MPSQTMTAVFETGGDSARGYRGWVIFAGITSLVLGVAAVISAPGAGSFSICSTGSSAPPWER